MADESLPVEKEAPAKKAPAKRSAPKPAPKVEEVKEVGPEMSEIFPDLDAETVHRQYFIPPTGHKPPQFPTKQ